jgi:hypothetical protein
MLVSANLLMTGVVLSIFTDDFWLFHDRLEWREPNILEALRSHPTNKGYLFVDQCFHGDQCKKLLNVLHSSSFAPSNARKFTRKVTQLVSCVVHWRVISVIFNRNGHRRQVRHPFM